MLRICLLVAFVSSIPSSLYSQDGYYFFDDFQDGDIQDDDPALWNRGGWDRGTLRLEPMNVFIDDCGGDGCSLGLRADGQWARYTDVSFRLRGRMLEGPGSIGIWGRSLDARVYFGFVNTRGEFGVGDTLAGIHSRERLPIDFDITEEDFVLKLDIIGDEISASAWRVDP